MFKKKKPQPTVTTPTSNTSADRSEVSTVIGSTTTLEGNLNFSGVLKVDGTIKGNLVAESDSSVLILDEQGTIEGEVHVPNIIVNGSISGNIFTSEKIDLYPHAKISGDIHYNLLEMEVGAEVNGRMLRQEKQPVHETAEVDAATNSSFSGDLEAS